MRDLLEKLEESSTYGMKQGDLKSTLLAYIKDSNSKFGSPVVLSEIPYRVAKADFGRVMKAAEQLVKAGKLKSVKNERGEPAYIAV